MENNRAGTLEHCSWTGSQTSDGKCKLVKSTEFLEIYNKLGKPAEEFHVCKSYEYASGNEK